MGLSTTGSISLAMALVAGIKRVPRPATGKTAFLTFIITPSCEQSEKNVLIYWEPDISPQILFVFEQLRSPQLKFLNCLVSKLEMTGLSNLNLTCRQGIKGCIGYTPGYPIDIIVLFQYSSSPLNGLLQNDEEY